MKKLRGENRINRVNRTTTQVLQDNKFHETTWAKLKVGDIVLVREDEPFPADLLLLQCSDHYGTAYIQTMTLDGERALKSRQSFTEILDKMKKKSVGLDKMRMHLKCENPNNKIYQFEGQLNFENPKLPPMKVTLNQFLLREAILSNTDWIIGLVVYAGHDTKIMRNMGKNKYKQTHIEKRLNRVVIFLIIFQTLLCLLVASLAANYHKENEIKDVNNQIKGPTYLFNNPKESETSIYVDGIINFLKYFLLLSSILPISLLVSLEVVKVLQSIAIVSDAKMFSVEVNQTCKVMTVSLNEELGLINNIFTDKTGTLTSNEMVFKACSVAKVKYDKKSIQYMKIDNEKSSSEQESQNENLDNNFDDSSDDGENVLKCMKNIIVQNINDSESYNEYRFGNIRINKQTDFLHYFWLALSLCHEVISISKNKQKLKKEHYDEIFTFHEPKSSTKLIKKKTFTKKLEKKYTVKEDTKRALDDFDMRRESSHNLSEQENLEPEHNLESDDFSISEMEIDEQDELIYHGMSPDEITLVEAAKKVGYEFRFRSNKEIEIRLGGVRQVYKLLKLFPFTSDRKRMTIVVQDPLDKDYVIAFVKGADNVMIDLSLPQFKSHFNFNYIDRFAKKGYRTLLVGMKVIR